MQAASSSSGNSLLLPTLAERMMKLTSLQNNRIDWFVIVRLQLSRSQFAFHLPHSRSSHDQFVAPILPLHDSIRFIWSVHFWSPTHLFEIHCSVFDVCNGNVGETGRVLIEENTLVVLVLISLLSFLLKIHIS